MTEAKTPTTVQFRAFENAYDYFNEKLFKSKLQPVILNLSRKSNAMGFFAPARWRKTADKAGKGSIHELSINPEILSMSLIDVYSTLVHEQCHIWQEDFGKTSRNGYHNKQWANKMLSIGLIPSDTGMKGGNMTGQNMSDYPEEGGLFIKALEAMPEEYKLPFTSIEGDFRIMHFSLNYEDVSESVEDFIKVEELINGAVETGDISPVYPVTPSPRLTRQVKPARLPRAAKSKSSKNKYTCLCGFNIWGKVGLNVICGDCEGTFELVD